MDTNNQPLPSRAMSAFSVSIGTSLALETLLTGTQPPYDPERVMPAKVKLSDYDEFWVNLLTLHRNILGALDKNDQATVMPGELLDTLIYEIEVIKHAVTQGTYGKTKLRLYASDYKGMAKAYPNAVIRHDHTAKQLAYASKMQQVIKGYFKDHMLGEELHHFDLLLKPDKKTKSLILTHYAHDLLSWRNFSELDLIESHTGLCKKRALWSSKLLGSDALARIPFDAWSMQVFGDPNTFSPFPIAVRKQILALAEQYKWHPLVTKDRVRFSFESMPDKLTAMVLKSML